MGKTVKFFWCEHCREEISFLGYAKDIVQAQAEHLFEEHGIDIHDPDGLVERSVAEDPPDPPEAGDRYIVTSISGYPITPDYHTPDTDGRSSTEWYVLDTVHCHEIVATYDSRGRGSVSGEEKARRKAHLLNRIDARHESKQRWLERTGG